MDELLKPTPWDAAVFGMDTYELTEYSEKALRKALSIPGHYTIRVDPTASKRMLYEYGFFYCDTLIEPFCKKEKFIRHLRSDVSVTMKPSMSELRPICLGAFSYGRFHRDFTLPLASAEKRYLHWLEQLHEQGNVMGLQIGGKTIGFIAYQGNRLLLHAIAKEYRGKGLAKYLWTAACESLFHSGIDEIRSSVSAANLPVVNLYASLGFRFENAKDIYHRLVAPNSGGNH